MMFQVVDVHFSSCSSSYCILFSYTGTDCPLGFCRGKAAKLSEKTQSTCWFWVLDNPAFAISYSVHNVCKKNSNKNKKKKRTNIWCYIILRSYLWVETFEVYRSSFCKHFLSKVEWKINIENYIMYNSSVEIAVVY